MQHSLSTTTAYVRISPSTMAPNARRQPLGTAGATQERTLSPVGWTPWLGCASVAAAAPGGLFHAHSHAIIDMPGQPALPPGLPGPRDAARRAPPPWP